MGGLVKGVETSRARTKQLLTDLEQSHHELRDHAAEVEELATAEERNRVARDIHDSVGYSFAVVNVQLEKALVFLRRDVDVTEQAMKDARRAAKEALGDVRESASDPAPICGCVFIEEIIDGTRRTFTEKRNTGHEYANGRFRIWLFQNGINDLLPRCTGGIDQCS